MSAYTIIQDISLELRANIFDALQSASGVNFNLTDAATNIVFDSPEEEMGNNVYVSLYLYHMDINKSLRNQPMLPQPGGADELRLPPMPLQLRYLFTPVNDDESTNHLIIGRVLQYFYDYPNLSIIAGEPVGDSFGGGDRDLRIKPDILSMEQLTQIWNAFNHPYRLSLSFLVEVVMLDSARSPLVAPRVVDSKTVVGIKERGT
jgi:hypothetical protein